MPPAGRDELRQRSRPGVDPELRLPVEQHVEVPVRRPDEPHRPSRILVSLVDGELHRTCDEPAEPDIGEPGFVEVDPEGQVVVGRA
jgi:hypothetical protein